MPRKQLDCILRNKVAEILDEAQAEGYELEAVLPPLPSKPRTLGLVLKPIVIGEVKKNGKKKAAK